MTRPAPPRPRAAFRVAVIGHRRPKLPFDADPPVVEAITRVLATVGAAVDEHRTTWAALYRPEPPLLTVLSALAEGADRHGATAARQSPGWGLHAVLPFRQADYERDFLPPAGHESDSRARFRELLATAERVTVLDGQVGRFDAYVPLGRTMVEMADLLIAVWDGQPPDGPGGTASMIYHARRQDLPVVRIDPAGDGAAWLEDRAAVDDGRASGLDELRGRVDQLLRPPNDITPALRWFSERARVRPPPRLYDRVLALIGGFGTGWQRRWRPPPPAPMPADPGETRAAAWRAAWPELDREMVERVADHFARQSGWADEMARWYAAGFRSTFTAVYALAVAAVLVGGLLRLDVLAEGRPAGAALAVLESIILAAMLWRVRIGRQHALHERWLDYRSLAERTRHLGTLWPLARTTPLVRVPVDPTPDDPRFGWVGWLLRAVAREAGLVPGRLDGRHPDAARRLVIRVEATEQTRFHRARRSRLGRLTGPVERMTELLVVLALVLSLLQHTDLAGQAIALFSDLEISRVVALEQRLWVVLAAVATALPALAAAIHGFLGTADLEGIALRSAAIEGRLGQLQGHLARLDPVDLGSVGEIALEMTRAMEGELGSWHTAAASRRLQAT